MKNKEFLELLKSLRSANNRVIHIPLCAVHRKPFKKK